MSEGDKMYGDVFNILYDMRESVMKVRTSLRIMEGSSLDDKVMALGISTGHAAAMILGLYGTDTVEYRRFMDLWTNWRFSTDNVLRSYIR